MCNRTKSATCYPSVINGKCSFNCVDWRHDKARFLNRFDKARFLNRFDKARFLSSCLKYEQIIWRKVACCSYTTPLKRNTCYESFSGKFLSNSFFVLLWVAGSERLHSKASLLKTTKAYKDQKENSHVL